MKNLNIYCKWYTQLVKINIVVEPGEEGEKHEKEGSEGKC